ncbi:MAG: hypothetical protein V3V84_02745 [Candidatus Bathyarchaeia archaeon]|jgi:uncharacterized membrane protein|nr:hypothetical protein [Candidatus Bathyarchaeota archaeon]
MERESIERFDSRIKETKTLLKKTFDDEILKILLNNSNITHKQFESLIINSFSEDLFDKGKLSRERPKLRTDRNILSRGSFDRTLSQARRNVRRSISTLLLLGYVGILESPELEPFLEAGNRIKAYTELNRESGNDAVKLRHNLSMELGDIISNLLGKGGRVIRESD